MATVKLVKSERDEQRAEEVNVYRRGRTYHAEIWSDTRGGTTKIGRECKSERAALVDVGWIEE